MKNNLVLISAPLAEPEIESVSILFHNVWHETQAPLQDSRKAEMRDLDFFRKRVMARAAHTTIVKDEGKLAGFVSWSGVTLCSLFVNREYRSMGVGGILCAEAERQLSSAGAKKINLDCVVGNFAARRFYEKRGWIFERILEGDEDMPEGFVRTKSWLMVKNV